MRVPCAVVNCINIFPLDPSTPIYQTSQNIFGGHKSLSHYTACFKFWVYFIRFLLLLFYFLFLFPPLLRIYEVYIHTSCKIKPISNDRVRNNSLQFFIVLLAQGHLNNTSTYIYIPTNCTQLIFFYKQHIKIFVLSKTLITSPTCFGHYLTIIREILHLS